MARKTKKVSIRGVVLPPTPRTPRKSSSKMDVDYPSVMYDLRTAGAVARAVANPTPMNLATAAQSAYKSYTSRKTQTSSSRRSVRFADTKYVSGGKFSKKTKSNPFAKYTKRGMVCSSEVGTVTTGVVPSLPLYVGHCTHGSRPLIFRTIFRVVVRDIYQLHGVNVSDIETDSPGAYTLTLEYQNTTTGAASASVVDTTGKSYNQIAGELYTNWLAIMTTIDSRAFVMINEVYLSDGSKVVAKRDYREASFHIFVKSDLKIQNRTLANGADEDANSSENVANQPLYGKSYFGKGNGLICKIDSTAANNGKSLICSDQTGLLTYPIPSTTAAFWLNEPPLPTLFSPKPAYTKAQIEPGVIRTSTLQKKMTCKQTEFWQIWQTYPSVGTNGQALQSRYGQFRIFAFEKMICATNTDTNPILGLEMNYRVGMYISFPRNKNSAEVYEGSNYI